MTLPLRYSLHVHFLCPFCWQQAKWVRQVRSDFLSLKTSATNSYTNPAESCHRSKERRALPCKRFLLSTRTTLARLCPRFAAWTPNLLFLPESSRTPLPQWLRGPPWTRCDTSDASDTISRFQNRQLRLTWISHLVIEKLGLLLASVLFRMASPHSLCFGFQLPFFLLQRWRLALYLVPLLSTSNYASTFSIFN